MVFTVPGITNINVLREVHRAMCRAIEEGDTLRDFRAALGALADRSALFEAGERFKDLSRTIYETNLRQSYNAGRWQQLQSLKRVHGYWRYRQGDAVNRTHPHHHAWDGLILSADDPWWDTHYPSNGWGCQCLVESLADRDLLRLGRSGPDEAPVAEPVTIVAGEDCPNGPHSVQAYPGIDAGFAYASGSAYLASVTRP